MNLPKAYVGVDVAKNWLDVASDQTPHQRIPNTPEHIRALAERHADACLIFEATGGYERPLMDGLTAVGVAFRRVNPRHARAFARASGRLAKTDKVDAEIPSPAEGVLVEVDEVQDAPAGGRVLGAAGPVARDDRPGVGQVEPPNVTGDVAHQSVSRSRPSSS